MRDGPSDYLATASDEEILLGIQHAMKTIVAAAPDSETVALIPERTAPRPESIGLVLGTA